MKHFLVTVSAAALLAAPAQADDVIETLESAIEAYQEGDIAYATEELAYAQQLLKEMRSDELGSFLPDAPEGWTRTLDDSTASGYAMMGGGTAVAAEYSSEDGEQFTITIALDSPMLAMVAPMIKSASAMGAKLERVGREKFANQNGELMGLIDNRIFVQASGADVDVMVDVLETMDFKSLEDFGR